MLIFVSTEFSHYNDENCCHERFLTVHSINFIAYMFPFESIMHCVTFTPPPHPQIIGTTFLHKTFLARTFLTGKVNFCTGTGRKAFFSHFFGLILDPPPGTYASTAKKRQIHLYRPFFSPLHGLFRKKGGTGLRLTPKIASG